MEPNIIGLICTVAFGWACSTHRVVHPDNPEELRQFNDRVAGKTVQVISADGREVSVRNLSVTADTTTWSADSERVATDDLEKVHWRSRGSAAGQGFGIGLVAGLTMGLIQLVSLSAEDAPAGNDFEDAVLKSMIPAAVLTGALGAAIAALVGRTESYTIRKPGAKPSSQ